MDPQTGKTHGPLGLFPHRTLSRVGISLLALLWLGACAPAAATAPPTEVMPPLPAAYATNTVVPTASALPSTEPASTAPLPVATSRGPNLEASDPSMVRLDSGGLQLVEFFRFT